MNKLKKFLQKLNEKEKKSRENFNTVDNNKLDKTTVNKRSLIVLIFFIGLFLLLVIYLVIFQLTKAESLAQHDHNKRNWVNENIITRGTIYDRNKNTLVHTQRDDMGNNYRVYEYSDILAPVTGYNSVTYGKTGIEKSYNRELLDLEDKPMSKFKSMVVKSDVGNDLNLTIDANLQQISYNYLQGYTGSIVIMNAKTGEVLSLVSNPSFNPNTLDDDWQNLIQNENAPLLNRATQGLYRPGSSMKVVTSVGLIENNIDLNYNDTGSEIIQQYEIKNFGDAVYGQLDLRSALVNSSNTYFAKKTDELGKEKLKETTDKFLFNKEYKFDLDHSNSKIPYDQLNEVDTAMTGFGYGKTQVTPLHMAMIASAIANDGKMMQPRLVLDVEDKDGKVLKKSEPQEISEVTDSQTAQQIREYMLDVVREGSGTAANVSDIQIAGKTGTAETDNGSTDAWFIGFAVDQDPQLAIAVVIENDGRTGGEVAAPIAGNLLRDAYYTISYN